MIALAACLGLGATFVVVETPDRPVVVDVDASDLRRLVTSAVLDRQADIGRRPGLAPMSVTVAADSPHLVVRDGDVVVLAWTAGA